jgi:flagellar M-ring protein FliF
LVEKSLTTHVNCSGSVRQILDNLRALGPARLAALGSALVVTVGLLAWLAASMTRPEMTLLYGGLEAAAAGEVVRKLEEMKVPHEVRADAILVPADRRDRIRMALADQGLPRRGQAGYELLDELGRFGTTTDMFNAAYWRAKEGELARTIDSLTNVREARVHLVPLAREPFSRVAAEPSASITVTTRDGAPLGRRQAQAIRHLVALGVKGLQPQRVTVIDASAGIVLGPDSGEGIGAADGIRAEREQRLRAEIEEMLAAHVGHGRVRISVALELDREAESVTERRFDPNSQVAIHTDTTEIEESSSESERADAVSVAGNLPGAGAAAGPDQSSRSARTETREVANFEVSEVRRERQKLPGAVQRVSVAVLVGGVWESAADGARQWRPQSEAELVAIQNLVQSAIGFDAERGDRVTVESLPFHEAAGTSAADVAPRLDALLLGQLGALARALAVVAVVFLVLWFVARPILSQPRAATAGREHPTPARDTPALEGAEATPALGTLEQAIPGASGELEVVASEHERAVHALIEAVDRKPEEALRTLRRWLQDGAGGEAHA